MPFDGTGSSPLLAVLIEGRRRIEESWCQGPEGMPIHGHCTVFAITRQNVGELTNPAVDALSAAVFGSNVRNCELCELAVWNDDYARTKQDVLDAYDRAIAAVIAA